MDASRKYMGNPHSCNRKARNQPVFRFPGPSYFTIGEALIHGLKYSGLKLNLTGVWRTANGVFIKYTGSNRGKGFVRNEVN